jgi:hypothetical protein
MITFKYVFPFLRNRLAQLVRRVLEAGRAAVRFPAERLIFFLLINRKIFLFRIRRNSNEIFLELSMRKMRI